MMNMKYSMVLIVVFCLQAKTLWAALVIEESTIPNIRMRDDIVTMTQDAINKYSTWGDRANSLRSMLNQNFGGRWGVSIVYGSPIEYASAYDADPYMKFSIDNFHIDVFQLELLMKTSSETRIGVPGLLTIG